MWSFLMQKQTKNKLNMLLQAGKINDLDVEFLNEIDNDLSKYDDGNKEEMLLIHVAMTISRQRNNEKIDAMPEALWQQIENKPAYQRAKQYWLEKKAKAPVVLSKDEDQYIIMHLVNVLSKGGQ